MFQEVIPMSKKKSKMDPIERFLSLSDAEKDAEVARFDKPLPVGPDGLPGKPLTPAQRKRCTKIQKRLRGRPTVGEGAKVLAVSVERGLLNEARCVRQTAQSQAVGDGRRRPAIGDATTNRLT
jgi:hypothetical protein